MYSFVLTLHRFRPYSAFICIFNQSVLWGCVYLPSSLPNQIWCNLEPEKFECNVLKASIFYPRRTSLPEVLIKLVSNNLHYYLSRHHYDNLNAWLYSQESPTRTLRCILCKLSDTNCYKSIPFQEYFILTFEYFNLFISFNILCKAILNLSVYKWVMTKDIISKRWSLKH